MLLTYNQIIKILNDWATAHYQVNEFGNGDLWEAIEHDQMTDFKYPLMWVQDQPSNYSSGEVELIFRVYFMNLVNKDESNENEVLSDMLLLCNDLLAWWEKQEDYIQITPNRQTNINSFTEKFQDELAGWYIDLKLQIPIRYDKCSIPMDGMTPIPTNCLPVSMTFNGAGISASPSGGNKDIVVQSSASGNPQVGTIITDTTTDLVIEVDPPGEVPLNTSNLYKTGATTSVRTGDDGDLENGRGSSWTVLEHNNGFGNTNRFTDTLGTQVYANDIVIDWAYWDQVNDTVCGWYSVAQTGATWNQAIDGALALSTGGYSDWFLPNLMEQLSICQLELSGGQMILLNYAPFNYDITAQSERLWTSTRTESVRAYIIVENANFQGVNTTNSSSWMAKRIFTLTELGL